MLSIVWILWALKIAGLTNITYELLGWLTFGFFIAYFVLSTVKDKFTQLVLEKVSDSIKNDKEGVTALLMLIYKKL